MKNSRIVQIKDDKKKYLDLLLLADEEESMIDRYLQRGVMFVMLDNSGAVMAVAVVTVESNGIVELKNLAVAVAEQGKGYGRKMVDYVCDYFSGNETIYVGTGEVASTMGFYEHCGFRYSHRIKDFFTDNYRIPIYDDGVLLTDMVYFKKDIKPATRD